MKKLNRILQETLKDTGASFNKTPSSSKKYTKYFSPKKRVSKKNPKDFFDFMSLVEKWGEIVGNGLLPHTHPLKNKNKILTVLVSHPAYALQLGFLEEVIKSNILKYFPNLISQIQKINFVTDSDFFKNDGINKDIKMTNIKKTKMRNSPEENGLHNYSPEMTQIKNQAQIFLEGLPPQVQNDPYLVSSLESLFIQFSSPQDH